MAHCSLISPLLYSAEEYFTELVFYLCSGTRKRGNHETCPGVCTSQSHPLLWFPPPGWEQGVRILHNSRMSLRVHSFYNTNSTDSLSVFVSHLFGGVVSVGSFKRWPNPVSMAGEVNARAAQLIIDMWVHQGQSGFTSRHKWFSLYRDIRRVPRDQDYVKIKFSSLRSSQIKKFPTPIPKQRPFEMLTTSPDIALTLCVPGLDFI